MKAIHATIKGFVLMGLICSVTAALGCSSPWVLSDTNCFRVISSVAVDHARADIYCKREGGRIASIHSDEDMNALSELLTGEKSFVYFGLMRNDLGDWWYPDTTSYDFRRWLPGEPSVGNDCAVIEADMWTSIPCSFLSVHFICRRPLVDRKAPEALCQNTTEIVEVGSTHVVRVSFREPTTFYDESSPVTVTSRSARPGDLFNLGETEVVYDFEDPHQNTGSCVFYVIVAEVDTLPPMVSCSDFTSRIPLERSETHVSFTEPVASDNSGHVEIASQSHHPGDLFSEGDTTVTYTYRDGSGHSKSCSFTVTVLRVDTIPPRVSCSDFTSRIPLERSETHVSFTEPIASDNSGHVEIASQSHYPGDLFTEGDTTVTYTYMDESGNSKLCSFTVTVLRVDTLPPTVSCSDFTSRIPLEKSETRVSFTEPVASDNSGHVEIASQSHYPGDIFTEGDTTVTYTYRDGSGHNKSCSFTVTVLRVDMTPPAVFCNNFTLPVPLNSPGSNVAYIEPEASDNSGHVTMTSRSNRPGDFFEAGGTEVKYIFNDESGNNASCSFYVIVEMVDMTPPSVLCYNYTTIIPLSSRGSNVSYTEPIASDNAGQVTTTSRSHRPGNFFAEGGTEVTYVFDDESGNNASCSFYVIVERADITPPKVVCHNFTETVPNDGQGTTVYFVEPIAYDNSGHVFITSQSHYPGDLFVYGETLVTYNFSDVRKNNATCSFNVIVLVSGKNGEVEISNELEKILKNVEGKDLSIETVYQTLAELSDLTSSSATLTQNDVDDIAKILFISSHVNTSSPQVTSFLLRVVDNLISSILAEEGGGKNITSSSSNTILLSIGRQLENIQRSGNNFSSNGKNIAVEVVQVEHFDIPILSQSFPSKNEGGDEQLETVLVTDNSSDRRHTLASIQLDPKALLDKFPQGQEKLPLSFVVHRSGILFPSSEIETQRLELNSFVIAASTTEEIKDLPAGSMVVTKFRQNVPTKFDQDVTQCMFWNLTLHGSIGGWSDEGCYLAGENSSEISCFCDHLTSFAILVNPYGDIENGLVSTISVIGCVISIICLFLTVASFLGIRTIRSKVPQRIIINLSFALLGLYFFFLIGVDKTDLPIGCVIFGALIHFFLLSAIAWMSVEATNMYLMFVKVINASVSNFLWKASVFAWVVPMFVVTISVLFSSKSYSDGNTCFPDYSSTIFYIAVFGPVVFLLIYNFFFFILVTWKLTCGRQQISKAGESRRETIRRLRNAFAISVLLGLTWAIGLLPAKDHILRLTTSILFCFFNSLQGCLIFLLFCFRHKDVQDAWKRWLHIPSRGKGINTKSSIDNNLVDKRKPHNEKRSERLETMTSEILETMPSENGSAQTDRSGFVIETNEL